MWNRICWMVVHVSSEPAMIPSSRTLLSRDKRLPIDTWNQSGLLRFYGNQLSAFNSPRNHPQRIQSDDVQRNQETVPDAGRTKIIHTCEDRLNQGTTPMPMTFATKPLTTNCRMSLELPQNFMVGQQRQQISELQFDKFPNPKSFIVWKIRFKTQVTTCSVFHRMLCCGSKKWRWLIHWTSWNHRDQFVERNF